MNKLKCFTFLALIITVQVSDSLRIPRNSDPHIETTTRKPVEITSKSLESETSQSPHTEDKSQNLTNKNESSTSPETASKLFEILNSTLLDVNTLIIDAMRSASGQKNEEFEKLGGLVRNVQGLISDKKAGLSADASHQLVTSLQNIQTFFTENEQHLQDHIMNRNGNSSQSNRATPKLNTTASDESSQRAGRNNGPFENLRRITNQVGEGLTASVRGVEDKLTTSMNQIQTSIQSQIEQFVTGINNFFTSTGSIFGLPNLLNLTLTS